MKHKASLVLILLFFLTSLCFSQEKYAEKNIIPHGTELCNQVLDFCKKTGLDFSVHPIVSSIENFNISVHIPSSTRKIEGLGETFRNSLIFIVSQEEIVRKSDFYTNVLDKLSAEKHYNDIIFLLTFPEKFSFPGFYTASGEKAFLQGLDSTEDYAAVFLYPDSDKTKVISGSGGKTAPSWLVKDVYNSINANRLLPSFKACYISFLYNQKLFDDTNLENFISAGIPSVSVYLNRNLETSVTENFLLDLCRNYSVEETSRNDTHSIMFTVFHKSIWITENTITKQILIVIFLTFMLLILYGFLNNNFQLIAWEKIKKIWFYPLIIYSICIFIFYTFKKTILFLENIGVFVSTASAICFILPMVFTVQSFFFFSILRFTPYFRQRTVDYLTLITSSINLVAFSLLDISLFPIFGLKFIFAWISTIFTKNFIHIVILILFEIPFLPFIIQLFGNASPLLLDTTLRTSPFLAPALFLMLLPQYLNSFRVFTGMNFYWFSQKKHQNSKDRNNLIILAVFLCSFELILFLLLPSYLRTKNLSGETPVLLSSDQTILSAKLEKQKIFSENLNTLTILSEKELEVCDIKIRGKDSNPILFSDNEFITTGPQESAFSLPYQPPKKLVFTFGSGNQPFEIRIRGIYRENGDYFINEIKVESK